MKCSNCVHWTRLPISDTFLPEDSIGECEGLLCANVEIEIEAGMNGGCIKTIETHNSFFCANFCKVEISNEPEPEVKDPRVAISDLLSWR